MLCAALAFSGVGEVRAVGATPLERARGAYEVGDYEQVIVLLEPAVKSADGRRPPPGTREDRVEAHLLLAKAYFVTYDFEASRAHCLEALKLDPDVQLDPVFTLPKFLAAFEQVRRERGWTLERFPAAVEATLPGRAYPVGTIYDPRGVPLWILPPGVGQFLNRQPAKGAILAGLEVGLFASTAITYQVLKEENPDVTTENVERLSRIRTANHVLFGALMGTLVVGAVDALVFRDRPGRRRPPASAQAGMDPPPPAHEPAPDAATPSPPQAWNPASPTPP